ncbi:MAG: 50S ribosomal protein L25 [Candidatus Paceibacterota bacterium]
MTVSLQVNSRKKKGAVDRRAEVLGVVYGPKQESTPLSVDRSTFEKLYRDAGESTIISLEGLGEPLDVLIHDVDFDPIKNTIRHVDFYAIERGKELTTDVPLEFVGVSPVDENDGVLTKVLHEVEVTCRPSNLPHNIEVDVSVLVDLETPIKVKDIKLPEGVKITNDPDDVVALIVAIEEEVEEPVETVDMDAIEVEQKGKEEGEAEEDKTEEK